MQAVNNIDSIFCCFVTIFVSAHLVRSSGRQHEWVQEALQGHSCQVGKHRYVYIYIYANLGDEVSTGGIKKTATTILLFLTVKVSCCAVNLLGMINGHP